MGSLFNAVDEVYRRCRGAYSVVSLVCGAGILGFQRSLTASADAANGTAVTLSLAEPMTAASLGILVLGEQLNPQAFFGISLILTGLVVLVVRRSSIRQRLRA